MSLKEKQKINNLIQTGELSNIILAFQLIKSNKIEMDFSQEEELFDWINLEYDRYQEWSPSEINYTIEDKLSKLFSYEKLLILTRQQYKIPKNIGRITRLKKVVLSCNFFEILPKSFSCLVNLNHLDLSSNSFHSFPKEICKLPKIRTILLQNNYLKEIPKCISNINSLKKLHLGSNKISSIPLDSLKSLKNLKTLNLEKNLLPSDLKENITKQLPHCEIIF